MTLEERMAQVCIFHAMKGIELDENDKLVLKDDVEQQ